MNIDIKTGFSLTGVLVAVLVVLVVGTGGIYMVRNTDFTAKETGDGNGTTTVEDKTTNWKTYRNEELGFEFNLPADFTVKKMGYSYDSYSNSTYTFNINVEEVDSIRDHLFTLTGIDNRSEPISLDSILADIKLYDTYYPEIISKENIIVDGIQAIEQEERHGLDFEMIYTFSTYLLKDSKLFDISMEVLRYQNDDELEIFFSHNPDVRDLFGQILSTFKFIESNSSGTVINDNNISVCYSKSNITEKDRCYLELANKNVDPNLCLKITTSNTADGCLVNIAGISKNISICEQVKSDSTKNICYGSVAFHAQNLSICDLIINEPPYPYGGYKDLCYANIAREMKDVSVCEKIKIPIEQDEELGPLPNNFQGGRVYCYQQVAKSLNDKVICDKIISIDKKSECINGI